MRNHLAIGALALGASAAATAAAVPGIPRFANGGPMYEESVGVGGARKDHSVLNPLYAPGPGSTPVADAKGESGLVGGDGNGKEGKNSFFFLLFSFLGISRWFLYF
jgi:hypothetical protein